MTREEIELVLSDLCTRTKYRPIIHVELVSDYKVIIDAYDWPLLEVCYFDDKLILSQETNWNKHRVVKLGYGKDIIKPYLRSFSSMTEEEAENFEKTTEVFKYYPGHVTYSHIPVFDNDCTPFSTFDDDNEYSRVKPENVFSCIDWLISHYFDYRGLIKRGLAIEAPKGMYNTKQ